MKFCDNNQCSNHVDTSAQIFDQGFVEFETVGLQKESIRKRIYRHEFQTKDGDIFSLCDSCKNAVVMCGVN